MNRWRYAVVARPPRSPDAPTGHSPLQPDPRSPHQEARRLRRSRSGRLFEPHWTFHWGTGGFGTSDLRGTVHLAKMLPDRFEEPRAPVEVERAPKRPALETGGGAGGERL